MTSGSMGGAYAGKGVLKHHTPRRIDAQPLRRKKEYVITDAGKCILRAEYQRLRELVNNGRAALEENV